MKLLALTLIVLPDVPNLYFPAEEIRSMEWNPPQEDGGGSTRIEFKSGGEVWTRFHPVQIASGVQGTGWDVDPTAPLSAPPEAGNPLMEALLVGIEAAVGHLGGSSEASA